MPLNASDVMTRNVVTVPPDASVAQVASVMTKHGISAVPVCEAGGTVVGMLSEGDLMRAFGKKHALRRDWWLNLLAEGEKLAPEFIDYMRADHRRAADLMTGRVVTAKEDTTLPEIADLLFEHRIKRVPIVRDGVLVGIVSRADIIRAVAQQPEAVHEPT
ncbi:MAG: CBS domain-containing protein [Acetobacteraceae bacterium]|nr:CBS domain-containing protein [Acetobacteraceae bacterium]